MKLKPCKCGAKQGHGLTLCQYTALLSGKTKWEVHCEKCGTTITHMESKEEAIEFWNKNFSVQGCVSALVNP